jgi:hypothetical protein
MTSGVGVLQPLDVCESGVALPIDEGPEPYEAGLFPFPVNSGMMAAL